MPKRERRRDARLTRRAAALRGMGLSTVEIADSLHTSEEAVVRLLKPLGGAGQEDETKRRKANMTETNEPIRTFEKRLPSLGEDAPPVKFTELANGEFIVDFSEEDHREPIRELAQKGGHDPAIADLPFVWGEAVNLSDESAALDLALSAGDFVEWTVGSSPTAYGQLLSVNEEAGTGIVKPMAVDETGFLTDTGQRKVTVALGLLSPTTKRPATATPAFPSTTKQVGPSDTPGSASTSDAALYKAWVELSGVGADEEGADLSTNGEEFTLSAERQEQDALRAELARQSAERDDGPPLDEPESRSLLERWRRHFFGAEDD